jgi:K+-transporting ATPase ATPase C chain
MKKHIVTAVLYTAVTALLLGILYPLAITGIAQLLYPQQANGSLLYVNGQLAGSKLIGQQFTGPGYFHGRPSSAGSGYDATASSGSNLGPTSQTLVTRIDQSVQQEQVGIHDVPVDLVTASASGLDPDITPAAALYQAPRIAQARHMSVDALDTLVEQNTTQPQLGLLGEPRVNVLRLNLALDHIASQSSR